MALNDCGGWVQLQLWKGATKWVALWLLLSVLTLLHAGALITAFYEVAIAKVSLMHFWSLSFAGNPVPLNLYSVSYP